MAMSRLWPWLSARAFLYSSRDGGAQHGGHRQIKSEKRRGLAVHAQQFAAQDGGARARDAGDDGQDLAAADLEGLEQRQLVAVE